MFRAGAAALQKIVAPASTPSRQVFDIVLKSGSISATELFAKAKDLKAAEGEASVRSKTFGAHPRAHWHTCFGTFRFFRSVACLRAACPVDNPAQAREEDPAVPREQDLHQGVSRPHNTRREEAAPAFSLPSATRL